MARPAGAIPEGYLKVKIETDEGWVEREILHPVAPGSIYHMTKTQDQLLFQFYARTTRSGSPTCTRASSGAARPKETRRDPRLVNRFDYDGDYGTVLNRFLIQAAVGHPLTVHGSGGQTRAFINIQDTVRCIALAAGAPADARRPGGHLQPDDRDAGGCATWPAWSPRLTGRQRRVRRQPAQRGAARTSSPSATRP